MQFNTAYSEPVVPQQQSWGAAINQPTVGGIQPSLLDVNGLSTTGSTGDDVLNTNVTAPSSYNQRTSERMRQDEGTHIKILCNFFFSIFGLFLLQLSVLEEMATISAVLYSNTNHPELKIDYPNWTDRCKQILKKWRALTTEKKAPYLQMARDNRSALRMKKAQQVCVNCVCVWLCESDKIKELKRNHFLIISFIVFSNCDFTWQHAIGF